MNKLPFEKLKRTILLKREAKGNYGINPEDRPTEKIVSYGVVNINKHSGPTSHQVSGYVQKILNIKKSGHSGTLDPRVTGILPIALGRATRIVQTLLPAGKEYIALMHLHKQVSERKIKSMFKKFIGKIKQKPPIKSAVKRVLRTREIYYIEVLEIDDQEVLFKIGCEAGTYIRKYIHDFGLKLGVGAHMAELIRTRVAHFNDTTAITLQDLTDAYWYYKNENNDKYLRKIILPVESAITHLPKIWVLDSTLKSILHGIDLKVPGISKLNDNIKKKDVVAVMSLKNELIAIGNSETTSEEIMKQEKGRVIAIHKVFMES